MLPRSAQRSVIAVTLSGLVSCVFALVAPAAGAVVPTAPVKLPTAIEPMPPYQPQAYCDPVAKSGTLALANLLVATYEGTSIVDTTRPCGLDTSEHYDGRAIDWGVSVLNATQKAQGQAFLKWLFATDAQGNTYANVRRLGIMYVIWNKRIWGSWSHTWEPYSCSGVTACHQDHMHISLDWSGAKKRTSFWTGVESDPMPQPAYIYRSTAFSQHVYVGARAAQVTPPFRVLGGATYRFTVTGTYRSDANTTHRADAECSTTDGKTWHILAPADTSPTSGVLDLWFNSARAWRATPGDGAGCNPTTHTYVRSLTFATTGWLTLKVNDPDHADASGRLSVTVQRTS